MESILIFKKECDILMMELIFSRNAVLYISVPMFFIELGRIDFKKEFDIIDKELLNL